MTPLTFGAFIPQGGISEFVGWRPADAWACTRDRAVAFDEMGYDHLWVPDHVDTNPPRHDAVLFETFTTLAAVSQVTTRAHLGQMVTCASFRNSGLLAKIGATIDVVSGGRFILGLGGGWYEGEYDQYGWPFPSPAGRVQHFAETIEAVVRLWSEDEVTMQGTSVRLNGAHCSPKPLQSRPPIWTGVHGPKALRAAARFADVANWNVGLDRFLSLTEVLREQCLAVGRDFDTIRRSVFRLGVVGDRAAYAPLLDALGVPPDALPTVEEQHFLGPPEEIAGKVQAFVDAGASDIVVAFLDAPSTVASAERFLREVVPQVTPAG